MNNYFCSFSGTFDVRNVTVDSVVNGRVCFTVDYVDGHETPPRSFVRLTCTTTGTEYNGTIKGTVGCLNDVPPQESYTVAATDADAVDKMNPPVFVTAPNISVPNYTAAPSTTIYTTSTATPTPGW